MPAYRLSEAAADDLVAIYLAGTDMFGTMQADRYQEELFKAFAFLAEFPRAARLRHEIAPPVRAFPYKAHLIVYDIGEDNDVLVVRVRHAREDWTTEG